MMDASAVLVIPSDACESVMLVVLMMLAVLVMLVVPNDVIVAITDLAMLDPNPGAKLSDGCEAVSQLSVKLPP